MTESYTPAATPATPAEAGAKLDALSKNQDWASKVLAGSGPHVREFNNLIAKKSGGDTSRPNHGRHVRGAIVETIMDGELSIVQRQDLIADLREIGLEDAASDKRSKPNRFRELNATP